MMTKRDIVNKYEGYINAMASADVAKLTDGELRDIIIDDGAEYSEDLSDEEIEWVMEEIRNRSEWYAVMDGTIEDNDWGTGSYEMKEAMRKCREFNDFNEENDGGRFWYIAVIRNDVCTKELDENGDNRIKTISAEDAEKMVVEGDLNDEFIEFLKKDEKAPYEWDYNDLRDFFRQKGYKTI